jgi:hypothetical protein
MKCRTKEHRRAYDRARKSAELARKAELRAARPVYDCELTPARIRRLLDRYDLMPACLERLRARRLEVLSIFAEAQQFGARPDAMWSSAVGHGDLQGGTPEVPR